MCLLLALTGNARRLSLALLCSGRLNRRRELGNNSRG